ncbi:MAG TPA: hypothetical protein VGB97_01420 [Candidatus Paceibacterota bacterium]
MLNAITPDQLAGPLPGTREPDGHAQKTGQLTEDMRRMYLVNLQLHEAQDAEILELQALAEDHCRDELIASLESRKRLIDITTGMLQHDIADAFPQPKGDICPGHIFSDGTIGVHPMPGRFDFFTSIIGMIAVGGGRGSGH